MCCNNNYFRRQPKIDSNWVNKSVSYMKANQSKLVKSALCFTSYAGVGGVITLLGACLLDYQILTDQSFQAISYMVQVRSIGYIVGSLSAASCEKYFQQSQILTVSNLILGGALIASPWFQNLIPLLVATLFVGLGLGILEICALGPAFTVKSGLKMSKQDAALLISVYWITCCIYRLVLIPVTLFVKEQYLIVINVVIMIIAGLLMIQSGDSSITMTWISFILMGMGFAPCFALAFGLVQKYFTIPGKMGSLVFLCGTIGESLHPWIVANYLESRPTFYTDYFASIAFCNSILCLFHVAFVTQIMSKSSFKRDEYQSL